MKLRVPEGCRCISHQGRLLEIAEDGSIEVEEDAWMILSSHGVRPWSEPTAFADCAAAISDAGATQVIRPILKMLCAIGADDCAKELSEVEDAVLASESQAPEWPDATSGVDIQDISALNRNQLFAFLKSKGISTSLPVTNDKLRKMARRALR